MNLDSLIELAKKLPKGYKENAEALLTRMGEVVEGIGDEPIRWRAPNLRLVQGTTDRSTIPKGTAIGDMLIGERKMDQPVKFIVMRVWDGRQYWDPDPNESKLLCSSPDAKLGYNFGYCNQCQFKVFNEETRKSECGKTKNALVIAADFSEIFTITFAKTNYQAGMYLESVLKKAGVAPYRRIYGLSTETNAKYKNVENYAVELLDDKEKTTHADLLPFLQELFKVVGEDRKESIDKFYELVLSRVNDQKQLTSSVGNSESADSVVVIEDSSSSDVSAGGETQVSDMAKNYIV
jgi:hypothetical protein